MQIALNCKKGNNVPKAFQLIAVVNYTHNFTCVTNYNQLLVVYMDLFLILKAPNSRLFLGNAFKPCNENCMFPFSAVVLKELYLFRRSLEELRKEKCPGWGHCGPAVPPAGVSLPFPQVHIIYQQILHFLSSKIQFTYEFLPHKAFSTATSVPR